jgi:hypothetical protein
VAKFEARRREDGRRRSAWPITQAIAAAARFD